MTMATSFVHAGVDLVIVFVFVVMVVVVVVVVAHLTVVG